ncbi:hypothetical protein [Bradyrhizobium sp. CCBAU 65884]|uniref:hypothetical protein n=1 Tax=Bradyrhizobium sp. CCBAU 65884 TaxID=722477 RepID=UPI0023051622|nr:hypothetical protein [Bradyrhizobium sp. CCBAU 65884]
MIALEYACAMLPGVTCLQFKRVKPQVPHQRAHTRQVFATDRRPTVASSSFAPNTLKKKAGKHIEGLGIWNVARAAFC